MHLDEYHYVTILSSAIKQRDACTPSADHVVVLPAAISQNLGQVNKNTAVAICGRCDKM